jgi:hypothetical protein
MSFIFPRPMPSNSVGVTGIDESCMINAGTFDSSWYNDGQHSVPYRRKPRRSTSEYRKEQFVTSTRPVQEEIDEEIHKSDVKNPFKFVEKHDDDRFSHAGIEKEQEFVFGSMKNDGIYSITITGNFGNVEKTFETKNYGKFTRKIIEGLLKQEMTFSEKKIKEENKPSEKIDPYVAEVFNILKTVIDTYGKLEGKSTEQPEVPSEKQSEVPSEKQPEVPSEKQPEVPSEKQPEVPSEKQPEAPSEKQPEVPSEKQPDFPKFCADLLQSISSGKPSNDLLNDIQNLILHK